jgi:hypothetical protein
MYQVGKLFVTYSLYSNPPDIAYHNSAQLLWGLRFADATGIAGGNCTGKVYAWSTC